MASSSPSLVPVASCATLLAWATASGWLGTSENAITSDVARILEFTFDGVVITSKATGTRQAIASQLMYTQGQLTMGHKANGQVGNVKLDGVDETPEGENKRIAYRASMPVAWPK